MRRTGRSRSGYYAFEKGPRSKRAIEDIHIGIEISESFRKSRRAYGSPRVLRDLTERGRRVSRKRVARIMRAKGALCAVATKVQDHDGDRSETPEAIQHPGAAVSFWSSMKTEMESSIPATRAEGRRRVFDYIEAFYNPRRRHSTLTKLTTPTGFPDLTG